MNGPERSSILALPTLRASCGTPHGYRWHLNHVQLSCDPCLRAWCDYTSAARIRRGRKTAHKIRLDTLRLLLTDPEAGRARLIEESGPYTVAAILGITPAQL